MTFWMMVGKVLMIASWLAGLMVSAFVIFVICKLAWDEIKPEKKTTSLDKITYPPEPSYLIQEFADRMARGEVKFKKVKLIDLINETNPKNKDKIKEVKNE